MIEKNRNCADISVELQIHKTYNQNISDQDVMQYILNLLECVSHIKTLQDLNEKW